MPYYSGDQSEKNEMGGECSTFRGEERYVVGRPEGMRPLGRSRHRLRDNIKEVGWCIDWIDLAQNRDT